jgi:hypothetical protein
VHPNLARKANVIRQVGFHSQTIALELAHFAGIACEHLYAASRAARVSTTAMKNVYSASSKTSTSFLPSGPSISCVPVAVVASILGIVI